MENAEKFCIPSSPCWLKEEVFVGPGIQKLLSNSLFSKSMNGTERKSGNYLEMWGHHFLGNKKDENYKILKRILTAFQVQDWKMSLKVHFLHSHVDYFSEHLGGYSD